MVLAIAEVAMGIFATSGNRCPSSWSRYQYASRWDVGELVQPEPSVGAASGCRPHELLRLEPEARSWLVELDRPYSGGRGGCG